MTKTKIFKGVAVGVVILLTALSFYIFGDDSQVLFANAAASEKPLRLHVLANSDSTFDQQLKLQMRDYIITILKPELADIATKEEAMDLIEANIPQLTEACNNFLADKSDYQASLALDGLIFRRVIMMGWLLLLANTTPCGSSLVKVREKTGGACFSRPYALLTWLPITIMM